MGLSLNYSGLFCILGEWGLIYGQMYYETQFAWYAEWLKGAFSYILPIAHHKEPNFKVKSLQPILVYLIQTLAALAK